MSVGGFSYPMSVLSETKQAPANGKKPVLLEDETDSNKTKGSSQRGFHFDNLELHRVGPSNVQAFGFGARESYNYMWYDDRLRSYYIWPKSHPIKPESLVGTGFYFTGSADKVQCPWCRIALSQWEVYDNPLEQHWKHSKGDCTFLRVYFPSKTLNWYDCTTQSS